MYGLPYTPFMRKRGINSGSSSCQFKHILLIYALVCLYFFQNSCFVHLLSRNHACLRVIERVFAIHAVRATISSAHTLGEGKQQQAQGTKHQAHHQRALKAVYTSLSSLTSICWMGRMCPPFPQTLPLHAPSPPFIAPYIFSSQSSLPNPSSPADFAAALLTLGCRHSSQPFCTHW